MIRSIFFFLLFCLCLSESLRSETEMLVGLDRSVIYEGETLWYQIAISSDKPIDDGVVPDLSAFTDFQVETRPKQVQNNMQSSSVVVVNGKVVQDRKSSRFNVLFTYVLTPRKAGSLIIPPPSVVVDGVALTPINVKVGRESQPVAGGRISVTVQTPDRQDVVRMKVSTNKDHVYPFQPITVVLTVEIKDLGGKLGEVSPLSLLRDPPQLSIPWLEDGNLPKGLQPEQGRDAWLAALNVRGRQRGFAINGLAERGLGFGFDDDFGFPFSGGFGRNSLLQFLPTPKQVKRPDADGKEQIYWEYKFSRTFLPQELGPLTFGPANVKGVFAVADSSSANGARGQQIYAIAPAVSVQVVDVPKEPRPADFIGAIGTFQWKVELQPRKASVGEPLTLTLSLAGRGSIANVTPPDLAKNSGITKNFKVYPPSEEVRDEVCAFTYTIRPTATGNVVFPSIPITFFDTEKEKFVTLDSEPITVEVAAAESLHLATASHPVGGELERSPEGLFANMTAPRGVVDQSVDFFRWAWMMASLLICYGVLAGAVFAWKSWNADPIRRRRRGAFSKAKRRLAGIEASEKKPLDIGNALQGVLIGYVADLTDGVEQGMTPKDVCVRLLELGVSQQLVAEVRGVLETLDGARFGGLDLRSFDDLANRIRRLLDEIAGVPAK